MAYRQLKHLDMVRITSHYEYTGRNGVVLEVGENSSRVQVADGRGNGMADIAYVFNKYLIIRHEPDNFIHDGQEDPDAGIKRKERERQWAMDEDQFTEDEPSYEACGDCECCMAHRNN